MPKVRVLLAPRAQPFDECIDSLNVAINTAQQVFGTSVTFEKVRGGAPGFQNYGPVMAHMLRDGDTHLFVAADDVVFPPDTIVRLVGHGKDVVSGIYRKNEIKGIAPANYFESVDEFNRKFKIGGPHETKFAAAHSLTIKREVIEKMILDYPELAYEQGEETHHALFLPMIHEGKCYQDDWAFSLRARQSGFVLWDDYGCKLKHFCSSFLGFEVLEEQIEKELAYA